MYVGYWSTAIMESAIFGIPTVMIDYSGLSAPHPFAKEGLCAIVHDLDGLKRITTDLYSSFLNDRHIKYTPILNANSSFYTGINDGKNSCRVADKIAGE